jgi:tetratricopeptide (TPR) repeat protein
VFKKTIGFTMQAAESVIARLNLLEGYLKEDPSNAQLLIDLFEYSLAHGQWDRAYGYLAKGRALASEQLAWALKEGDFWTAQGDYAKAREVLLQMGQPDAPPQGFTEVLLHNLAYLDFKQKKYAECVALLSPTLDKLADVAMEPERQAPGIQVAALQTLWLRALHHDGQITRACQWATQANTKWCLSAQAAGVASLIAIDATQFVLAKVWVDLCIRGLQDSGLVDAVPLEAYVACSSLALANKDGLAAVQWANQALQLNALDGRALSARALGLVLVGDIPFALRDFASAIDYMPGHIGTRIGQAWAFIQGQDLPSAEKSFQQALALNRNFAESHGGLAVALALQQKVDAAKEHIELAMRLDKRNLSARYAQAILSGDVGNVESLNRLAKSLLSGKLMPFGGEMADIVADKTKSS